MGGRGVRAVTLRGLRWVGSPKNRVALEIYDYAKPGPGRLCALHSCWPLSPEGLLIADFICVCICVHLPACLRA